MIEALNALQNKIARLETERAAAAEKFESLSSRTNQKKLDIMDRPILTENVIETPRIEPVSLSELSTRDNRPFQVESLIHSIWEM